VIFHGCEKLINITNNTNVNLSKIKAIHKIAIGASLFCTSHNNLFPIINWFGYEPFPVHSYWKEHFRSNQTLKPSVTPSTSEKSSELYALLVDSIVLRREERLAFPFSTLTKHFIRVCINSEEEDIYNDCIEAQERNKEEQGWKLNHDLMLQKICCHPLLAYGSKEKYIGMRSSKIERAMELISEIIKKNEKVIVMVKWRELIKLIADRCDELKINYLHIDRDCGADKRTENENKINNQNDTNHVLITTVLKRKESLYGANNIIFFNETENLELGNTYVNTIKGRLSFLA